MTTRARAAVAVAIVVVLATVLFAHSILRAPARAPIRQACVRIQPGPVPLTDVLERALVEATVDGVTEAGLARVDETSAPGVATLDVTLHTLTATDTEAHAAVTVLVMIGDPPSQLATLSGTATGEPYTPGLEETVVRAATRSAMRSLPNLVAGYRAR